MHILLFHALNVSAIWQIIELFSDKTVVKFINEFQNEVIIDAGIGFYGIKIMVQLSSDFKLKLKIWKNIFAWWKTLNGVQELIKVNKMETELVIISGNWITKKTK